ncbi:MAG TPA: glycosyltransferase family 2 protein [Urbifossiella sp.]|nr:glycosyltransferase family 2 protein [Urbifossiella sp.]
MALAVPPEGGPPLPLSAPPVRGAARPSAPRRLPELSVVIVNFCQWRNTARLALQLRRSLAARSGLAEIVIVDNHSPFHPAARRLKRLSGVTIRGLSRNQGFARAVNRGCGIGMGDWLLLLNPDVTVEEGFLDEVQATLDRVEASEPTAGVIGFRLRNADGSGQASSGPLPTLANSLAGLLRPRSRRKCRHQDAASRQRVAWITGGCLLVRRDCFKQLGGLDESFFLYYEDVDFCRRAADAGWSVWYDPGLEATHHWPLHARRVPAPLRLMTRHALLTYARKHWPRWQAGGLAGLLWAEAGLKQAWAAVRGDRDSARCYGELRRLIGDVCQGRTAEARKRVRLVAAFLAPIAAEQDGRTL